jgi:hypothetical protein
MKLLKSIVAGFAGAVALNILHETARRLDTGAPRIDLLGEEAVEHSADALHFETPTGAKLYNITLAGDVISNTAYYTMIGLGGSKSIALRAVTMGLSAGIGALKLPEPMGLNSNPVSDTDKKQLMTVGYYIFGALVSAGIYRALSGK